MNKTLKSALFMSIALGAGLISPIASAQFSFDSLVDKAVNAATQEVTSAVSTVVNKGTSALTANSESESKKSGAWSSSEYKFYDYANAPKPKPYLGPIGGSGIIYYSFNNKNYQNDALDFDTLPLQYAIVRVHGNGKRKIAMFTDPTCPYSRRQEQEMNKLDNVTIYTFVAPMLGSKSEKIVEQIQCQPTNQARAQAYDNWVLNRVEPTVVAPCEHVAQRILGSLGNRQSEDGTYFAKFSPLNVFQNDIAALGYHSRAELEDTFTYKTKR